MKRSVLTLAIIIACPCLLGFTAIIEAWSAGGRAIRLPQLPPPNTASISDVTVTEGDSGTINARFTVSIVRGIDFTARFDFATANGTATVADNDYVTRTGTVTFGFGLPIAQTIDIVVNGDARIEGDETFLVNLTRQPDTDLGVLDGLGVCTILNDDSPCTFSISPNSQSFPAGGATNDVIAVTAPTGCAWTATSHVGWITITSGASGSGVGNVTYSVGFNPGAARTGTMTIAGRTFTASQTGNCELSISPTSQSFPIAGGPGAVGVTTPLGCAWIATSNAPWITVTLSEGLGDGIARFAVAPNTGTMRTGTLTIGGQTFAVTQEGICEFALTLTGAGFDASGGNATVNVVTQPNCTWTATSNAEWIIIRFIANGTGSGVVGFSVLPNPGLNREGTITIAGNTFAVTQEGEIPCEYSFSMMPANGGFPTAGGTGTLSVVTPSLCKWSAISRAPWITISTLCPPERCSGNGSVEFAVAPNPGRERTGFIDIAGRAFAVKQAGISCSYTLSPGSQNFDTDGGVGSITVTAPTNCEWQVRDKPPWISITSGASGNGTGIVLYRVPANSGGEGRSATLTIASETFTVNQCGAFYRVLPTQEAFSASERGGSPAIGTVDVSAPSGCSWSASSNASWITITSGATGRGEGRVVYTVARNTGQARFGTISIAGQTFRVAQADPGCVSFLSPASQRVPAKPDAPATAFFFSLQVIAPSDCTWRAVSSVNWLALRFPCANDMGSTCTGNGRLDYSLSENFGAPRTGVIIIGGQIFTIEQTGANCDVSVSPLVINLDSGTISRTGASSGDQATITVTTGSLCEWEAKNSESCSELCFQNSRPNCWVSFSRADNPQSTCSTSGVETTSFIVVAEYNSGFARTTHITVAGQQVQINQNGRCPIELLCAFMPDSSDCQRRRFPAIELSRAFRDKTLARSERGIQYSTLYYQFSDEAVRMMMRSPSLVLRFAESFERYKPVIEAMANGEQITLSSGDLDEIDSLLNSFAERGSDELKQSVKSVCEDLRNPVVHQEFQLQIVDGPKRELTSTSRIQSFKRLGIASTMLGLGALFACGFTGRRLRYIKRHSTHLLLVLLAIAGLANCVAPIASGNPPPTEAHSTTGRSMFSRRDEALEARIADSYRKLPLVFEENQGQADPQVRFLSRGNGYNVYLKPAETVITLRNTKSGLRANRARGTSPVPFNPQSAIYDSQPHHLQTASRDQPFTALRMKLIGANPAPKITGVDELPARTNYFIGNNPALWRSGVPAYARVKYSDVYKGVDLIYYGDGGQLEYDFNLAAGADYRPIALQFAGSDPMKIDSNGDIVFQTAQGEVRQRKPIAFQEVNGRRKEISCRYRLSGPDDSIGGRPSSLRNQRLGFEVGVYDNTRPLTIDPVFSYSTYLGGSGDDEGNAIAVDSAGNAYIVGFTDSTNFPASSGAQPSFGGGIDAFVTKLNPSGTGLIYSTYIGGAGQENGTAIAVDSAGNAYVTGFTDSTDFPLANILQSRLRGLFNAFVLKLSPSGSNLAYSTYLGGTVGDFGSSIAVDSAGSAYVAGVTTSPSFPVVAPLQQGFAGVADAFIAKFNPSGSSLAYSTLLGGAGAESITGIALDSSGNAYVSGITSSANLPVLNPAQSSYGGGTLDAFVMKVNATGTALVYSTYLGGGGEDHAFRLAVDVAGDVYVTGDTASTDFPVVNAVQPRLAGGFFDAFVTRLNQSGNALIYSTYLGGSEKDAGTGITVDSSGNAYVTGFTDSTNFPTANPVQPTSGGGRDAFAAKLTANGETLNYSTYLGGSKSELGFSIAVDSSGNAYVLGQTDSTDFPMVSPYQRSYGGGPSDVFVAKISATTTAGPRITGAAINGKNLIVTGSAFDAGARILVNGQSQKTINDAQNPATTLIGRKSGRLIVRGQTVSLQVRNSNGALSPEFRYTQP